MKRKTLLILLIVAILSAIITIPVKATSDSKEPVYTTIGGEEYFFANGTPITISEDPDNSEGAIITWTSGGVEKEQKITGPLSNVFGGTHDDDTIAVNSSITIEGGYIAYIHGGGLHRSNTLTSTIVMNGGQVGLVKGGGASSWTSACGCTDSDDLYWKDSDYENAPCQTGTATVTINDGIIEYKNSTVTQGGLSESTGKVYGGGNGYANTGSATVIINGGDMTNAYVTAGGSNGNTTEGTLKITGGEIMIAQTVNRGTMETAALEVTGGEIENLYVTAEPDSENAVGVITETVTAKVSGDAKVETMQFGQMGTTSIVETNDVVKKENIQIVSGTVTNSSLLMDNVTRLMAIKIDGDVYELEEGTVKDLPEYQEIITKDGYKFVEFKWAQGTWDADEELFDGLELTTVFEKVEVETEEDDKQTDQEKEEPKDTTPTTGTESTILPVFATIAVISLVGLVAIRKRK